jgi:hypothetical protein
MVRSSGVVRRSNNMVRRSRVVRRSGMMRRIMVVRRNSVVRRRWRLSLSVYRGRLGRATWLLLLLCLHGKRIGF